MGVKVRVKRNIGENSEEYFGKPNGKVYELTDNFKLVDDGGHEWGYDGFKDEQEFIEYMKDIWDSSTEFEVVREKSKWKCVELNETFGFTEGKIYEVGEDGMIYYDSGEPCEEDTFKINGNKAECWWSKFEKVENDEKVKLKVGDRVVVNGVKTGLKFNNDKGKIVEINRYGDIGVEFDTKKSSVLHSCDYNGKRNSCWYVDKDMATLDNTIKKEKEKVVNKFKVGDLIKGKANIEEIYGFTNQCMTKGEVTKVYNNSEIEVKILEHSKYNREIGNKYDVESDYFELVTPSLSKKSIHLTFDGNTTHAVVKEDGKVVKREKVGLCHGDVYDEAIGVREVINKLYGKKVIEDVTKEKVVEPKTDTTTELWRCVWKGEDCSLNFTVGKVYVRRFFNDGMRMDDNKNKNYWVLNPLSDFGTEVRFERVKNKTKSFSEYTTDELLSEIKKRMEK